MASPQRLIKKTATIFIGAATALGMTGGRTTAFDSFPDSVLTFPLHACMDKSFVSGVYKDTFRQYATGAKGAAAAFTAQCLIENQLAAIAASQPAYESARQNYRGAAAIVEKDFRRGVMHSFDHVSRREFAKLYFRADAAGMKLKSVMDSENAKLTARLAMAEETIVSKARPGMETDIVHTVFDIVRKPELIALIDATVPLPQNAQTREQGAKNLSANRRAFEILNPALRWAFHEYPQDVVTVAMQVPAPSPAPLPAPRPAPAPIQLQPATLAAAPVTANVPPVDKDGCAPVLGIGILIRPLANIDVSSSYGIRVHPIFGRKRMHTGLDLRAPMGTPVYAAASGTIETIGWEGGYGRYIAIAHTGKMETAYGHLNRFTDGLHEGSRVKQGDIIGYVGETGWATGPHLHYEVRLNGEFVNPKPFLLAVNAPQIASSVSESDGKCLEQVPLPVALRNRHDARPAYNRPRPAFTKIGLE